MHLSLISRLYRDLLHINKKKGSQLKDGQSSNEVEETGAYYTEWSKPERKTPIPYTNTYIWKCKTQNLGLRSKGEKPHDPINQPSRCNTQEGLLSVAQTGDSHLLGGRAPRTANWASFLYAKNHTISILHTGYKVIGYTFTKQSYWHKLRGLLFKLRRPLAVQLSRGLLLGAHWLAGSRSPDGGGESHHFTGNRNPSPGRLPAPAPVAPHNKTYFSASKTNKKNNRHMNYRHW